MNKPFISLPNHPMTIQGETPFDPKKSLGENMHLFLETWIGKYPDSAWKDLDTLIHGANTEDLSFTPPDR